jgi:DNA-binding SARP family transcriptional activator/tetratricopeptide (TPR) repeat protein
MRFGVLGPLTVTADDDRHIELPGQKIRLLMAALLCGANQPVTDGVLVDALWGAAPPRRPGDSMRVYVHHLRQALGESRIRRRADGYELLVHPGELDVDRFGELAEAGRRAAARDDRPAASASFRAALALWRGPALAGFEGVTVLGAEAYRLEELRLDTLEQRFEVELALGWHNELCAELRSVVNQHPLRETLRAQLMRALAGSGRGAEAIAAFEDARQMLADEFGLDPGQQLRDLHLAILRDELDRGPLPPAETSPEAPGVPAEIVPRQLPADLAGFAGRAEHLEQLDGLLAARGATVVATVCGTAGIGKTSLAVHWAHRVAHKFPDGQLYLNLHGFDPARPPMDPTAAIGLLLGALGVSPQRVPHAPDARESLYRSVLADRRMLVVLDNARDAAQVRPLLPGSAGCVVVVTSRNVLNGLVASGAHPITLDLLSSAEAQQLLLGRLGGQRVDGEPAAVEQIVARCGGLPLPLSIVAARAAIQPRFRLVELVAELGQARSALDGFASDDASVDLRAVFSWSYRELSEAAARLFRLLALHPGPEATAWSAASLVGMPVELVRSALAELTGANLLAEPNRGRYTYHDLLRAYAIELTEHHDTVEQRDDAVRRVLDHFVHTAYAAATLIGSHREPITFDPPRPGVVPQPLASSDAALAWFDTEHVVLLAAATRAEDGFDTQSWQLGWSLYGYLDLRGDWPDQLRVQTSALAAARRTGQLQVQAHNHRALGRTFGRFRQYDNAYRHLHEALRLHREVGNLSGQGNTLLSLGEVLEFEGRHRESLEHALEAFELYRQIGHTVGEANSLNAAGWNFALLGEYEQALEACEQALEIFVAAGDRAGQAAASDSLGYAYQRLGQYHDSLACYRRALDTLAGTGDRYFVAIVLDHLGDAYRAVGDTIEARHAWRRALTIFTELEAVESAAVRLKLVTGNPSSQVVAR